jgi:drug/metabolite transporter (DMT)-like permease
MICNLSFLLSLKFIPFSKASIFFWTSPVFTAIIAHYHLKEHLSIFDWAAVFIAFFGILIIQDPFGKGAQDTSYSMSDDLIGSALALFGSLCGSCVVISIRIITTRTKLHYMVIPMGFVLGNLALCPVFLFAKVFMMPVEQGNMIVTENPRGGVGSSFHSYSNSDVMTIILIALLNIAQQLA